MPISVAILGSGNMAFHLLRAFDRAGVPLAGLISRDLGKGRETLEATGAKCELVGGLHLSELEADIIILAIPESSIQKVLRMYEFNPNHIVAHTSGAEPLDSLHLEQVGVFYPLQTLTWGETTDLSSVPILVEGSNIVVEEKLMGLANHVSKQVSLMSSQDRLRVHLAAVLACNFPNHLMERARQVLDEKGLNLNLLFPLIEETIRKIKTVGPLKAQTGPALRGDQGTMEKHLELIEDDELKNIYRLISQDISHTHAKD